MELNLDSIKVDKIYSESGGPVDFPEMRERQVFSQAVVDMTTGEFLYNDGFDSVTISSTGAADFVFSEAATDSLYRVSGNIGNSSILYQVVVTANTTSAGFTARVATVSGTPQNAERLSITIYGGKANE